MDISDVLTIAEQSKALPTHPDPRFPPSPYFKFLRAAAAYTKARVCVELGVCGGGGSLHMCLGTSGIVIGVDIRDDYPEQTKWIQDHFDNWQFWLADSIHAAQIAKDLDHWVGQVDLLFIDTIHTYERTWAEYNAWRRLLSKGALVCLDDLYRPGMDLLWAEMPEPKVRLDWLHPSMSPTDGGFGVLIC